MLWRHAFVGFPHSFFIDCCLTQIRRAGDDNDSGTSPLILCRLLLEHQNGRRNACAVVGLPHLFFIDCCLPPIFEKIIQLYVGLPHLLFIDCCLTELDKFTKLGLTVGLPHLFFIDCCSPFCISFDCSSLRYVFREVASFEQFWRHSARSKSDQN